LPNTVHKSQIDVYLRLLFKNTSMSTFFGLRFVLRPAVEKILSEGTDVPGIAR